MTIRVNNIFPGELVPSETVAGCIDIFENVWPDPYNTIKMVEKECANSSVYWERATTIGDGIHQNERTNHMLGVTYFAEAHNNAVMQNIHNQFNVMLLAATIPYSVRNGLETTLYHEPYSLLKYSGGQEYKAHYDGDTITGRAISALVYLNDDYEGGELEFPNFKIKIKPQAGMLILFPSNFAYRHIAHPVTKGTKYAIVTWIQDRQ